MKRIFEKSINLLRIVSKMENKYEYEEVDDFDEDVSFDLFFFNTCMSGNFMCLMIVHALSFSLSRCSETRYTNTGMGRQIY